MKYSLKDKYVVITGASGGIGSALAAEMINKCGAKIIGVGRTESKLAAVREKLGENFEYRTFDVSCPDDWKAFAGELVEKGVFPALIVNNAGVFPPIKRTFDEKAHVFESVIKTDFLSAVYATEALLPLLRKNAEPGIFNVCSSAALCTVAGTAAYTAAKRALEGYTESLILENGKSFYAAAAYPGVTMTDLFRSDGRVAKSGVEKIASSPEKVAKKMCRAIQKRKKRVVIGFDAVIMSFLARFWPYLGLKLVAFVMKKSGAEVFDGLFDDDKQDK